MAPALATGARNLTKVGLIQAVRTIVSTNGFMIAISDSRPNSSSLPAKYPEGEKAKGDDDNCPRTKRACISSRIMRLMEAVVIRVCHPFWGNGPRWIVSADGRRH